MPRSTQPVSRPRALPAPQEAPQARVAVTPPTAATVSDNSLQLTQLGLVVSTLCMYGVVPCLGQTLVTPPDIKAKQVHARL